MTKDELECLDTNLTDILEICSKKTITNDQIIRRSVRKELKRNKALNGKNKLLELFKRNYSSASSNKKEGI